MQDPVLDEGRFFTENASRYLQQLCKHFAHKTEVTFDTANGHIAFAFGTVELIATAQALEARVSASSQEDLARARRVIDDHLARFAFRETFEGLAWDSQLTTNA